MIIVGKCQSAKELRAITQVHRVRGEGKTLRQTGFMVETKLD